MTEENFDDVRRGLRFGYGHWLQPIIMANDESTLHSLHASLPQKEAVRESQPGPPQPPEPELLTEADAQQESSRRGRGRPRVARPRNDGTVEVFDKEPHRLLLLIVFS